jgi:hypothetical protein
MTKHSLLDFYDPVFYGGYSLWAGEPYRTASEVSDTIEQAWLKSQIKTREFIYELKNTNEY